jgi:hypothetical protein
MEAVQVSQQVGQGITLQKDNILLLIDAWERLGYDLMCVPFEITSFLELEFLPRSFDTTG